MRLKDNQDLMLSVVPFLTFTFWILVKPFRHLLMEFLSSVVIPCKLLETSKPSLEPDDSVTLIYRQACLQIPRTQLKPQCSGKYHILITPLFSQKSISLVMIFQNSCQFISTIITTKRNESKENGHILLESEKGRPYKGDSSVGLVQNQILCFSNKGSPLSHKIYVCTKLSVDRYFITVLQD